jgi:serine/threonine protein kinase
MTSFSTESDIAYLKKNGKNCIGRGAYGQVCLIENKKTKKGPYALKKMSIIDKRELEYIKREIKLHKKLKHPFIIEMIDHFYENEFAFIILEYANHGNLYQYLYKTLYIPQEDLLKIFLQVVLAVEYMHKNDILHRDIKPENILLDEKRNAKLGDFGWSTECHDYQIRSTFCGTPEYMSPEMIFGKGQRKQSDVYSLGNIEIFFYFVNLN